MKGYRPFVEIGDQNHVRGITFFPVEYIGVNAAAKNYKPPSGKDA